MSARRWARLASSDGALGSGSGTGRDRWLLSYADFMTLLLALFVVLYASARVDETRDASLFEGLQAAFVFDEDSPSPIPHTANEMGSNPANESTIAPVPILQQLEAELLDVIDRLPREPAEDPGISLHQSEQGLVITLASAEFFPAGGVAIPADRRQALGAMAPLLASNTASLRFEGHTDAQPIRGAGPYPSNWELSSARAAAVARLFIDDHGLDASRIAVTGYAEQRPLEANDDVASRARNRRVEIIVLADGALVPAEGESTVRDELDQLLEELPPLPPEADESLRPEPPGPAPEDIPLP